MSLPSIKVICDYDMLLWSCWSYQLPIVLIFLQKFQSPLETLLFFPLRNIFSVEFLYHSEYFIFAANLPLGHSLWQCLVFSVSFVHVAFVHVGCWLFLVIKCPWVSLVCPIRGLLNLTLYFLQLSWALSNYSIWGSM